MKDTCVIRDLALQVRLGVPEAERAAPQRVLVTVTFPVDAAAVAKTDELSGAVDYALVAETLRTTATGTFRTLEKLSETLAQALLTKHALPSVTVSVTKFPLPDAAGVTLTISRP